MKHIYEDVTAIKEQLYSRLRHPYLMQHIDEPFVDDDKLLLLYSILTSANLHTAEVQRYATAIMLVQIALDTHENVSNKVHEEKSSAHKYRQLTALAGDYYSGLYYYLLAKESNVALIRALAKGIEEVNEGKIILHQQQEGTASSILRSVAVIESALLQRTGDHFNVSYWNPFAASLLKITRLQREYESFSGGGTAPVFAALQRIAPETDAFELYRSYLRREQHTLQAWLRQYPDVALAAKLAEHLFMKL